MGRIRLSAIIGGLLIAFFAALALTAATIALGVQNKAGNFIIYGGTLAGALFASWRARNWVEGFCVSLLSLIYTIWFFIHKTGSSASDPAVFSVMLQTVVKFVAVGALGGYVGSQLGGPKPEEKKPIIPL